MKNYYLYIILWFGAILIATVISFFWNEPEKPASTFLFGSENTTIENDLPSSTIINDLLLSFDELNISGTTFSNYIYKRKTDDIKKASTDEQKNTSKVYDEILRSKLEKMKNKKRGDEFSIKPVPK